MEHADGSCEWFEQGLRHRLDGPAVTWNGDRGRWWYRHGKRQRSDGPAFESSSGDAEWWCEGELLARRGVDGTLSWFEDGQPLEPAVAAARAAVWQRALQQAARADARRPATRRTLRRLLGE